MMLPDWHPALAQMEAGRHMSSVKDKGESRGTTPSSGWRGKFDPHWLEEKVHDTYRDVVDEPLPKELLDLVGRIPELDD
jgi:hypothetical protein